MTHKNLRLSDRPNGADLLDHPLTDSLSAIPLHLWDADDHGQPTLRGLSREETVELSQVGAWIAQFNKTLDDLRDQTGAAVAQREELIARLSLVSLSEARDELSQLAAWVAQFDKALEALREQARVAVARRETLIGKMRLASLDETQRVAH